MIPHGDVLEIRHLATDPSIWGAGTGHAILEHVDEHARQAGFQGGELWVITDNVRAIDAYRRAGGLETDDVAVGGSGRPERRYVRDLTQGATAAHPSSQ